VADSNRRDEDVVDAELPAEAAWIADAIEGRGERADPAAVERVLRLHRAYLTLPPPDIIPSAGEEGESDAVQLGEPEPDGPEGLREPADRPPS
jgi:hypothetical protein